MTLPKIREVWEVRSRNLQYAVFLAKYSPPEHGQNWLGLREKFGNVSLDQSEIRVLPLRKIGEITDQRILLVARFDQTYDAYTGRPLIQTRSTYPVEYAFSDTGEPAPLDSIRPMSVYNQPLHWALDAAIDEWEYAQKSSQELAQKP